MTNPRAVTLPGRLAALGFADTATAERLLTVELGLDVTGPDAVVLDALAAAADPDLALGGLARLPREPGSGAEDLLAALRADGGLRARLTAVLGASAALADHLRRHPADWRLLASPAGENRTAANETAGQPGPDSEPGPGATPRTPDDLRVGYRRGLLRVAARDLTGLSTLEETAAELADLAAAALRGALAIAVAQLPPGAPPCRLAVIAMGKCGARELNYASDVDVIFVAEPPEPGPDTGPGPDTEAAALRTATQLASAMIRICSDPGPEGSLFPVDPNLRPEGRHGPLVRTLASHVAYYQRWAKTWEFQALLKARPVAGDAGLGQAYVDALAPMVWQAAQRPDFVGDVQAMRRRVIASLPAAEAGRELKLGPGGLRDIEFAVQLLQLVHGRADESLREPATLPALAALAAGGYVGRQDAVSLASAYRFLRAVEHLLQLRQLRRTHSLPTDPAVLRQVGRALRSMDLRDRAAPESAAEAGPRVVSGRTRAAAPAVRPGGDPVAELTAAWRLHTTVARQLHEKLFYRPLLDAVARLPGEVIRLTSAAAVERLEALGYADPAGALRHIEALTAGVSRKAAIQRALLPAMLGWFADAPRPDPALLAFRQVSEALGGSPWYLRLLRDDTRVAWRMARLLASGSYPTGLLMRAPEAVGMLADDDLLVPRTQAVLAAEASALTGRHGATGDLDAGVAGLLALRRRELFRTACADVLGMSGVTGVAGALSTITAATIGGAVELAQLAVGAGQPLPMRLCVIAMGRFGGRELGYASDADVLFGYEPEPGADEEAAHRAAHAVAEELTRLLARPGPLGPDRCRPEARGQAGPAGPDPGRVPGVLPALGAAVGGAGAAPSRPGGRRRSARPGVHRAGR